MLHQPVASFEPHSPAMSDMAKGTASATPDTLSVPARHRVIREGEQPEHIHLLLSGMACRFRIQRDGTRQIIAFLFPGDFCDLQLFGTSEYAVSTLNVCKFTLFPRAQLATLAQQDTSLALALLRESAREMGMMREWLVTMGSGKAERQLAHLFCELHARLATCSEPGALTYSLPVTQADVADALGLSPVHVNRVLMLLRKRGLVSWSGGVLTLLDPAALESLAEFNSDYLPPKGRSAATRVALQNALARSHKGGAESDSAQPGPIGAEIVPQWAVPQRLVVRSDEDLEQEAS
ncbi:Crp/Fnr family transcriptional regulator [Muricoccus radiodurans]|uniref:Crp/Fnr family transcriptional regulator n=1 Tax=Muricoccus radiodurans TaxID=2231721 RepID=UPI003CF1BEC2